MMKNLSFAYIVSLFVVFLLGIFALSYSGEKQDLSNYIEVTVQKGDSIWKIAEKYEEYYGLDKMEFIKWVEKKNNLINLVVKPGDTIVVPVEKNMMYNEHLLAKEK